MIGCSRRAVPVLMVLILLAAGISPVLCDGGVRGSADSSAALSPSETSDVSYGDSASGTVSGNSLSYSLSDTSKTVSVTLPDTLQTATGSGDLVQTIGSTDFVPIVIEPKVRTTIFTDSTVSTLQTALGDELTASLDYGKITISLADGKTFSEIGAVSVGSSAFVTATGYSVYDGTYAPNSTEGNKMGVRYDSSTGVLSWNGAVKDSNLMYYYTNGCKYFEGGSSVTAAHFEFFFIMMYAGNEAGQNKWTTKIETVYAGDDTSGYEYTSDDSAYPWINLRTALENYTPDSNYPYLVIEVYLGYTKTNGSTSALSGYNPQTHFFISAGNIYDIKDGAELGDVDVTDLGVMETTDTGSVSGTISVTESAFKGKYAYTMTFSLAPVGTAAGIGDICSWKRICNKTVTADGSGDLTAIATDSKYTGTGFTVGISEGSSTGSYILTTQCSDTIDQTPMVLRVAMDATVDGEQKTYVLYYKFTVCQDFQASEMEAEIDGTAAGGSYFVQQISATIDGTALTVSDYRWYATNLPTGLSMSSSGYVSGIYVGSTDTTWGDIVVTAESIETGVVYTDTVSMSVSEYTYSGPTFTVSVGGIGVGDGGAVAVRIGDEVSLTLTSDSDFSPTVVAVDSLGAVSELNPYTDGTFVYGLTAEGTGAYRVSVTATSGDYEMTVSFYLYVMPAYGDLDAGIVVSA